MRSTSEDTSQAEKVRAGLAALASGPRARKFYRLLHILFEDGYAETQNEAYKAQAGLTRVEAFCRKLENWAGRPLDELKQVRKLREDGQGVLEDARLARAEENAACAIERLLKSRTMPNFTPYEAEQLRQVYMSAKERAIHKIIDKEEMTRRKILLGAIGIGAMGVIAKVSNEALPPRMTPEQEAEEKAMRKYMVLRENQDFLLAPPVDASQISPRTEQYMQQGEAARNALDAWRQASSVRAEAGQPSIGTALKQHQDYNDTKDTIGKTLVGTGILTALMNGLHGILCGPDKKTVTRHDASMDTLRHQLVNNAERLANGMDALLEEIVRQRQPAREM